MFLQPPPSAEELALKDEITQVLTSQGVLSKLKAELRAAVFDAMHEREGSRKMIDGPRLSDFPKEISTIALSLIVECLQFFHWKHALGVLLAETNTEKEQQDGSVLATKLGLSNYDSLTYPILFHLVQRQLDDRNQHAVAAETLAATEHSHFSGGHADNAPASAVRAVEPEEDHTYQVPKKKDVNIDFEGKDGDDESNADFEESMGEEAFSVSELGDSSLANEEDERSYDQTLTIIKQPISLSKHLPQKSHNSDKDLEDSHKTGESVKNELSMTVPPPTPVGLPSLPPLVGHALARDADDDFDAEEEAERLRRLDAALQAMEAEDDTGTLQQLKVSLQLESHEQDSFVSSGGLDSDGEEADDADDVIGNSQTGENDVEKEKADDANNVNGDPQTGENDAEVEGDDDYGTSDFEEEEEIASDISEELESMPEFSDRGDDTEDDRQGMAAADTELPRVLQFDTRVDSEDVLNNFDYVEDVEKDEIW
ncbi:uncharacterized protein PHALS_05525 [Plasmopara halstedii]|uniref:LisH domain-containing protein n=1 Tax=Plasmopara halstedii TaxID=4781 RepID=A0A0P1B0Y2_PLAHL|nr:uncharacterized protein PHALS_05525 [Plasmopara halstedii]CEG48048.1 hypothetical protein PHALS_05525 [Plasmopara halstedii]|eukprot:XP_024584417.1 hypothetical protein PHALS_05525 [Plasmopara halstedii]